ncbi:MAG: ABC transporter ATP-binding protein [Rhodospirillaceae bacterium]|nr:ABC transporter ATP-binding protein [Rhodospirillaceae bacterium]
MADSPRPGLHLEVRDLSKSFGQVHATRNVNLSVERGEVHAIIGPNGAGKTTLIAQLSGAIRPDSGEIIFDGHDIAGLPAHKISMLGLARSFQVTSIFLDFTAEDNVALAVQAHADHSFKFWKPAQTDRALRAPARQALETVGLGHRADTLAADLSHCEQRQLEIAMAMATGPSMLLLDEPTAGMGAEESAHMVELLRGFARDHTILLIEHDMDAVFALADRITVLVYGEAIATGAPDEIRGNDEVRAAYLGED